LPEIKPKSFGAFEKCRPGPRYVFRFYLLFKYKGIVAWFKTVWKKQILVRAVGIQKENWEKSCNN